MAVIKKFWTPTDYSFGLSLPVLVRSREQSEV
jgi:hypothetical protein